MTSNRAITITLALLLGCAVTPLRAASHQECQRYAEGAVLDYKAGTNAANAKQCRIQKDARWQPDFQANFRWCLTAQESWLKAEKDARADVLFGCHARVKID
jgi:hypothetical protein